jgi:thiamine-phosphate pyrophosphorylase
MSRDVTEIILISDRKVLAGEPLWMVLTRAASAGLTSFMLREKDLPGRALLALAREAVERCRPLGVSVLVNDRVDVALAAGADGVHLGGEAIPATAARRIAGERLRIGVSTHSIEDIRAAALAGADYAIFGPVFETPSKVQYGAPQGVGSLRMAVAASPIAVIAVGGIDPLNAAQLAGTGIAGVAVIRAILAASDPAAVVFSLRSALATKDIP